MRAPRTGFELVEGVTADATFVARGDTLAALFAAAADALLALTLENPGAVRAREHLPIALEEPDGDLLLLRFLSELIFLRDARRLLLRASHLEVTRNGVARLAGELVGESIDFARHRLVHDVKAATPYGLAIEHGADGYQVRVTLDV
jgi:SHS2 domain-containing protein